MYNFRKNQRNKLLFKIILQKYSRTGQANLPTLMRQNITITKTNEINYYLQSNFRIIKKKKQAKLCALLQYNENKCITLARNNEISY